jgi:DNA-binding NarL/FixJ family response regulator
MPKYHILIVTDQTDVRHTLRSGLVTLGPEFEIVEIFSGEEAFLELTRRPYHLVITEVHLPGISGIELMQKIKTHRSGIKVVLITGDTESKFRRQVADAGADAFFIKPIQISHLHAAVSGLLGLASTGGNESGPNGTEAYASLSPQIFNLLTSLRDELEAISVFLFAQDGKVIARVGDFPDAAINMELIPLFSNLRVISNKLNQSLGKHVIEDLVCFSGTKYNLSLTHLNPENTLLVVTNTGPGAEYMGTVGFSLHLTAQKLRNLLPLVELTNPSEQTAAPEPRVVPSKSDNTYKTDESLSNLDGLLQSLETQNLDPEKLDVLWDSLIQENSPEPNLFSSDALSFDQAKELGVAPENDDE